MISYGLVEVYEFRDLDEKAKRKVMYWLDEHPLDYENDEGGISYEYFSDMDEMQIIEHCDCNEYKFDKRGNPIHHLILTEYNPEQYKQTQTNEEEF